VVEVCQSGLESRIQFARRVVSGFRVQSSEFRGPRYAMSMCSGMPVKSARSFRDPSPMSMSLSIPQCLNSRFSILDFDRAVDVDILHPRFLFLLCRPATQRRGRGMTGRWCWARAADAGSECSTVYCTVGGCGSSVRGHQQVAVVDTVWSCATSSRPRSTNCCGVRTRQHQHPRCPIPDSAQHNNNISTERAIAHRTWYCKMWSGARWFGSS